MNKSSPWGIHWFRRDLRTFGNAALDENRARTGGRTLGLFCFDSKFLGRTDFSHNRFAFFLNTMEELRKELRSQGGDLLVVDCLPQDAFEKLFAFAEKQGLGQPSFVSFNRDYEPFARERDERLGAFFHQRGVPFATERDHLLFEPHEIVREDGPEGFYRMYSPYARKWMNELIAPRGKKRLAALPDAKDYSAHCRQANYKLKWPDLAELPGFPFADAYEKFREENAKMVTAPMPDAGFATGLALIEEFKGMLDAYNDRRDFPAEFGTSEFSRYFKNGSLTLPFVIKELGLAQPFEKLSEGRQRFLKELVWREYYYNILFHRPDVEKNPFQLKYKNLKWDYDKKKLQAWIEGRTGFPIVDAGMRELGATGWINNRVRIIVASFLIKDLLLDWRLGENYFMKVLLDGDLASNNGNWQWVASTGSEAQPFFRVMNPWLQGKKFDPNGDYIRRFVPELKDAPAKALHDPEADRSRWGYLKPMVDHATQKEQAIARFKKT